MASDVVNFVAVLCYDKLPVCTICFKNPAVNRIRMSFVKQSEIWFVKDLSRENGSKWLAHLRENQMQVVPSSSVQKERQGPRKARVARPRVTARYSRQLARCYQTRASKESPLAGYRAGGGARGALARPPPSCHIASGN